MKFSLIVLKNENHILNVQGKDEIKNINTSMEEKFCDILLLGVELL